MIIVMFGAPGVGKGTQAELLSERKNIPHLSTGQVLREAIQNETALGKLAKQTVEAGELVSDEIVTGIVKETLCSPKCGEGCILDGFPRTEAQAKALDEILAEKGKSISQVINIVVPTEEIVSRMLLRGRKDDTEEIIRNRLKVYEDETLPLLEYYKNSGKLSTIDGDANVEDVYNRIEEVLQSVVVE